MITTPCNLDYLIPAVRLRLGDMTTPYTYTDAVVRTALVNGVTAVGHYWNYRYFIYDPQMDRGTEIETSFGRIPKSDGLQAYDALRNPTIMFNSLPPPIIETTDEAPVVCAATILCLRARISSSVSTLVSWQTPDFSYNPSVSTRQVTEQLRQLQEELSAFFNRRLGKPVVSVI